MHKWIFQEKFSWEKYLYKLSSNNTNKTFKNIFPCTPNSSDTNWKIDLNIGYAFISDS